MGKIESKNHPSIYWVPILHSDQYHSIQFDMKSFITFLPEVLSNNMVITDLSVRLSLFILRLSCQQYKKEETKSKFFDVTSDKKKNLTIAVHS